MKWIDKILDWESGEAQIYPDNIVKPFFFETYRCDNDLQNKYKEKFIQSSKLIFKQDYTAFDKHIQRATNKDAISFFNLSKDALLVIPIPRKNKDFSTIKGFIDNATLIQQKHFWQKVASTIKKALQTHDHVYVSTHGLGVPYFHLRIDFEPKYYQTKSYI
jgi:hypothetical protein